MPSLKPNELSGTAFSFYNSLAGQKKEIAEKIAVKGQRRSKKGEDLMKGIIKKFDPQGFGIIEASDGSKLAFILSDFTREQSPQEGQKVISQSAASRAVFSPAMSIRSGKLSRQFS